MRRRVGRARFGQFVVRSSGQTCCYRLQAYYSNGATSAASNAASVTVGVPHAAVLHAVTLVFAHLYLSLLHLRGGPIFWVGYRRLPVMQEGVTGNYFPTS